MSKTKWAVVLVNLLLLLGYFNWSIMAKEHTLDTGKLVLLKLAPVDPRSLMQGDYMRLNYEINQVPDGMQVTKRGYCILKLDEHSVGTKLRLQDGQKPLNPGEVAVKYYFAGGRWSAAIHVGAESYFFEEGQAAKYDKAVYGALRVDDAGNSVLVGLYDAAYKKLGY